MPSELTPEREAAIVAYCRAVRDGNQTAIYALYDVLLKALDGHPDLDIACMVADAFDSRDSDLAFMVEMYDDLAAIAANKNNHAIKPLRKSIERLNQIRKRCASQPKGLTNAG